MITKRAAAQRGHADHGWLQSHHSFSFAEYHDPAHMGYGPLRVINDDRIAAGQGFGMHGHRDMEILTYVMQGRLTHRDSLGHEATTGAGDVQRMTAGRGIMHSEFNADAQQPVHLLQIWVHPTQLGLPPSYEQAHLPATARKGRLQCLAAPQARDGGLSWHADALLLGGYFDGDPPLRQALSGQRKTYVHLACGQLRVNGQALEAGDALMMEDEDTLSVEQGVDAQVLVFDLPR